MRISNRKQLTVDFTYFYVTYQLDVCRFVVSKIGRKFVYYGSISKDIEEQVIKGHWYNNEDEAADYAENAKKIRIVRRIFDWQNTHLLTSDECIEFYEKYGGRIKQ